jgi:hypothetical protein
MNSIRQEYPDRVEYRNDLGYLHRIDGPAIEYSSGTKFWYLNHQLHRIDGPAIEYADGDKEYWLNGQEYSFEEWDRLRKLQAFT